jgi:hypothetical protein
MHGSRSKIPSKISRPYIYLFIYVKFLALLRAPYIYIYIYIYMYIYIYDIGRLRVKSKITHRGLNSKSFRCKEAQYY